jgi:hypothetical protein
MLKRHAMCSNNSYDFNQPLVSTSFFPRLTFTAAGCTSVRLCCARALCSSSSEGGPAHKLLPHTSKQHALLPQSPTRYKRRSYHLLLQLSHMHGCGQPCCLLGTRLQANRSCRHPPPHTTTYTYVQPRLQHTLEPGVFTGQYAALSLYGVIPHAPQPPRPCCCCCLGPVRV